MINRIYRLFCKHKKVMHIDFDGTILDAYYQCEKCEKITDFKSINLNEAKTITDNKKINLWKLP
jgi:hypothetical protein